MRSSVSAATALALWGAAHAGGAAADDVLAALSGCRITAGVRLGGTVPEDSPAATLPGPGEPAAGPAALLPMLRLDTPVLVLPRAGDVRGLPAAGAGSALTTAAVAVGAAVLLPGADVTVVPIDGQWRLYHGVGVSDEPDPVAAREELDAAVLRATAAFAQNDLGRDTAAARNSVAATVSQLTVPPPPGTPPRAAALLHRCIQLEAVLAAVAAHDTAAASVFELGRVADALMPLTNAARHARRAAVAMAVRELVGSRTAGGPLMRTPGRQF